jgi:hypothetical protein
MGSAHDESSSSNSRAGSAKFNGNGFFRLFRFSRFRCRHHDARSIWEFGSRAMESQEFASSRMEDKRERTNQPDPAARSATAMYRSQR